MDLVEIWRDMIKTKEDEDSLLYRKIDVKSADCYIQYNISDNILLFIIDIPDMSIKLPKCKGVKYEYKNNCLAIYCDKKYADVFIYFTKDIYDAIKNQELIENIKEILIIKFGIWKYFFETGSVGEGLSKEIEVGLIGELITLKRLIIQEGEDVINYWNGPLFLKHDFNLPNVTIESKATVIKIESESRYINIHGLDQLYDSNPLYLHVHILEEDIEEGKDLSEYINAVLGEITEKNYKNFYKRLASVGYSPNHKCTQKYSLNESNLYKVSEGFPRLPITKGVDNGVTYKIYINAMEKFKEYEYII